MRMAKTLPYQDSPFMELRHLILWREQNRLWDQAAWIKVYGMEDTVPRFVKTINLDMREP